MREIADPKMETFLEKAEKVKAEMTNEKSKSLHKPDALKTIRSRINSDIVTVLKRTKAMKPCLESTDSATAANRRNRPLETIRRKGLPSAFLHARQHQKPEKSIPQKKR